MVWTKHSSSRTNQKWVKPQNPSQILHWIHVYWYSALERLPLAAENLPFVYTWNLLVSELFQLAKTSKIIHAQTLSLHARWIHVLHHLALCTPGKSNCQDHNRFQQLNSGSTLFPPHQLKAVLTETRTFWKGVWQFIWYIQTHQNPCVLSEWICRSDPNIKALKRKAITNLPTDFVGFWSWSLNLDQFSGATFLLNVSAFHNWYSGVCSFQPRVYVHS